MKFQPLIFSAVLAFTVFNTSAKAEDATPNKLGKINHIIVISLENHSFDNLFGLFPGADGLDNSQDTATQVDKDGKPFITLPPINDKRFPPELLNSPFQLDPYVGSAEDTPDLVHRFYQEQTQIDGGKMDKFALVSDAGGLTMGYYDGNKLQLWKYAKDYVVADRFFHAAFGGSFLNHFWMICACTPKYPNAPDDLKIKLDNKNNLVKDGAVTDDGYAVNTLYPSFSPQPIGGKLLPPQDMPTIGDRLTEKNIDWKWYSGGWDNAVLGNADKKFEYHHQPFVYFKNYAEKTKGREDHLKDEADFLKDIDAGTLPAVSFYKPLGEFDLHPGYTDVASGDDHIGKILDALVKSPNWKDSVIIVTFDENGGFWDHVPPPAGDRFGPGVRVPTIIISPFARKSFVDHTIYDTTSILKLIEERYDLKPLGDRDEKANDLTNGLILN